MSYDMDDMDLLDAAKGVFAWLESQGIDPDNGVPVLATAIMGLIHEIASREGKDSSEGGRVIAEIIMRGTRSS